MLKTAHSYAHARRLHQQTNHMLQHENATADAMHAQVRDRALTVQTSAALTQPAKIIAAISVWTAFTFFISYLTLPFVRALLGMSSFSLFDVIGGVFTGLGGLLVVMPLLWFLVAIRRTRLATHVSPDQALAATTGSLMVWGLLHCILPGLTPFGEMGMVELGSFLGSNIIESALFGVMLAAFSTTGRQAFSLGMLFQTVFFGVSYLTLLAMV